MSKHHTLLFCQKTKRLLSLFLTLSFLLIGCFNNNQRSKDLKKSLSPYIQENSNSAVDWHRWSNETLQKAKKQNKLIYLSIGFMSCYSCQKMDQETHSSKKVADILNRSYISIKMDREERPDIDSYFLNLQSAIMKFGGWPIQLILTPDLKPLFSLTYMQENPFIGIIENIERAWQDTPEKLKKESSAFVDQITPDLTHSASSFSKDEDFIHQFYSRYTHLFDPVWGGKKISPQFTPKFLINEDLRLLIRYFKHSQEKQALDMVKKTLSSLIHSATHDPLEGGFHRYSLSRDWNIPQFEKTLVDQASTLSALVDFYSIEPSETYQKVIEQTVRFVLSHLRRKRGGFYNSLASESNLTEGSYYTWLSAELKSQLDQKDWMEFQKNYVLSNPIAQYNNRSVLIKKDRQLDLDHKLEAQLIEMRKKRYKIKVDKQVTTANNSYWISSLCRMARIWPSEELNELIKKNLDYLLLQHRKPNGELYRLSVDGRVRDLAILDDYAFLIDALIEFYQISFENKYLDVALDLQKIQDRLFYDSKRKLYRFSQAKDEILKNQFLFKDQSQPSAQSLSHFNLTRLSVLTLKNKFNQKADLLIDAFPDTLKSDPLSFTTLLLSLDFQISKPQLLIIYSDPKGCLEKTKAIYKNFFPYGLVDCKTSETNFITNFMIKKQASNSYQVCNLEFCFPKTDDFSQALKNFYNQSDF